MAGRQVWMDQLRGLAVVLVVILHTHLWFDSPLGVWQFNHMLGGYRLGALFFASGLLLDPSLRKGVVKYVGSSAGLFGRTCCGARSCSP